MAKTYQDMEQIKKTLEVFRSANGLFEIRDFGGNTQSGYFKDTANLLNQVKNTKAVWYFVLNEIDESCYHREQREKILQKKQTTKDADIIWRNWLFIDCDPERKPNISSTDDEKKEAYIISREIYKWLKTQGFEEPIFADSGNGYHLLYRIDIENNSKNDKIISEFTQVLSMLFGNNKVKIDKSIFNAGRITKLYGTLAQKGADTQERPHRLSKLVYIPDEIKITGKHYIMRISDMLPKPEPRTYGGNHRGTFDLREFMQKHGIRVKQETTYDGGVKFVLEQCIFDPSHKGKDAAIFLKSDGVIGYHCFHNSCSEYQWRDVRLKFEPDAYDDKNRADGYKHYNNASVPNYRKREYKPLDFDEIMKNAPKIDGTDQPQPIFYTTEQIRNKPNRQYEYIPTGIIDFDSRNRGLCKGKITCLSGETGCGKSSLVSLFMLEAVQNGYKAALFSGELEDKDAYNWLILQAAGKKHIRPTQYENFYVPNEESEQSISKWLDDKLYIYNNDYGNKFEFIREQLSRITAEKQVDLIILDNLMSMDIENLTEYSNETNKQQTVFVQQLKQFAKVNNVHILFVAHPKKPNRQYLIDKYDVCGSSNIVNMVDNILIIYRTAGKYYTLKKSEFKVDVIDEAVGSELRICKDRSGGEMDRFIPLYFERESKRLKNKPEEIKYYGWQEDKHGFVEIEKDPDLPFE